MSVIIVKQALFELECNKELKRGRRVYHRGRVSNNRGVCRARGIPGVGSGWQRNTGCGGWNSAPKLGGVRIIAEDTMFRNIYVVIGKVLAWYWLNGKGAWLEIFWS